VNDAADDHLGRLTKRLLLVFLAMVVVGFALPSSGAADNTKAVNPLYQALAAPSNPELLIVPEIKLRAPVVPIELDPKGVLTPPSDVHEVGWWRRSAKPGATSGQTLVTGHTVHTGGGVMNRLGDLRPGATIQIRTPRGTVDYRATKVFVYTKAELAAHAEELFSQDRKDIRLVLVTCTGWTGKDYTSNIIVFADQLGVRAPAAEQPADRQRSGKAA
jgi:LPXTG-site transpeptidase (sortase) family protein